MKTNRTFTTLLAAALLATGCATVTTTGPTTLTDPPLSVTPADRENAALAFISYVGDGLDLPDAAVDSILYFCVRDELNTQPLTKDKYRLVWGPAVFKFTDARLDDNMVYVVRREGTNEMVVAVRGTNFASASDWLVEDFNVRQTVAWNVPERNKPTAPPNPRISAATDAGLTVLQTRLKQDIPGLTHSTVREFLADAVQQNRLDQVTLVGHSLAGALAPAFALWLSDTQPDWDPEGKVQIRVTPLAGATAGNRDYSEYYDSQLGASTRRLHNPYDIVPLAWNEDTLMTLPGLYAPGDIRAGAFLRFLIQRAMDLAKDTDYTQITPDTPSLKGGIMQGAEFADYLQQAGWQHHCGYYCGLSINTKQTTNPPLRPLKPCAGTGIPPVMCKACPEETP